MKGAVRLEGRGGVGRGRVVWGQLLSLKILKSRSMDSGVDIMGSANN